jgi:hypothetical protein
MAMIEADRMAMDPEGSSTNGVLIGFDVFAVPGDDPVGIQ